MRCFEKFNQAEWFLFLFLDSSIYNSPISPQHAQEVKCKRRRIITSHWHQIIILKFVYSFHNFQKHKMLLRTIQKRKKKTVKRNNVSIVSRWIFFFVSLKIMIIHMKRIHTQILNQIQSRSSQGENCKVTFSRFS